VVGLGLLKSLSKLLATEDEATDNGPCVYVFSSGVHGESVDACLKQLWSWVHDGREFVEVQFYSDGGHCDAGLRFLDEVARMRRVAHVTTRVSGFAGSMAGVMLQAGTRRVMGTYSTLHLHPPAGGTWGNARALQEQLDRTNRYEELAWRAYAERSRLTADQIRERVWEQDDLFLSAEEALELGFIDEID
jgi:ATP-dependent protease ClpP protease subunit